MKFYYLFFQFLSAILFIGCSKNVAGLFLSSSDYKNNKLTCNKNINNNSIVKIEQSESVFGYKLVDSTTFRIFKNKAYRILKTNDKIVIYKSNLPLVYSGKTNVTIHYYSVSLDSELKKLTIKNILSDFIYDAQLIELVKKQFKFNSELIEIDNCTQQYRILNLLDLLD